MEKPELLPHEFPPPCSSGRRSSDSKSPEFEFWVVGNPSCPPSDLHSADELFSGGFLLPLHLLKHTDKPTRPHFQDREASESDRVPEPEDAIAASAGLLDSSSLTSSKRWTDIFRKNDKNMSKSSRKLGGDIGKDKEAVGICKEKKREKKNGTLAGNGVSAAELNINLWPFSRSRSAGNGGTRPRSAIAARKVRSAPCSRSNSGGESKSRKWPSSPGRPAGIHLGRNSPVWQVRRSGSGRRPDTSVNASKKGDVDDGNQSRRRTLADLGGDGRQKSRVLSLKVPMCIGYHHHSSCRSDDVSTVGISTTATGCISAGDTLGEGVRGSHLFNIRSLFTKKVH